VIVVAEENGPVGDDLGVRLWRCVGQLPEAIIASIDQTLRLHLAL